MPAAARPILACAFAALFLSACGDSDSTSARTAAVGSGAVESTPPTPKPKEKGGHPPAGDLCQSQLGGLVGSMDSLRRRLAVGVTYDQYVNEVHAVGSIYRKVPAKDLRLDCVTAVGVPAEKAFNRYVRAANAWGGCVGERGCGSAQIEPVLQQDWRIASHFLSEARDGLLPAGRSR